MPQVMQVDQISIPSKEGLILHWNNVQVLVVDVAGLDGVLGLNLLLPSISADLDEIGPGYFNSIVFDATNSHKTELRMWSELGLTPGDANADGMVNGDDFVALAVNYTGSGGTGKTFAQGDFDRDGDVDGDDFVALAVNYTGTIGQPGGELPEPLSLSLLAGGAVFLLRKRQSPLTKSAM